MEPRRPFFPRSPFAVILQVGFLNALLVTFVSAAAYALINGAGFETGRIAFGVHFSLWELAKTVMWLVPLAAVSCGWFGLFAGFVGGGFMCLRGPRISATRLLIETSLLGLLLACLFPVLDALINRPGTQPFGLYLLAVAFGPLCAFICALAFHQRCRLR